MSPDHLVAADVISPGYVWEIPDLVVARNLARQALDGAAEGDRTIVLVRTRETWIRWAGSSWIVHRAPDGHLDVDLDQVRFGFTRRGAAWALRRAT